MTIHRVEYEPVESRKIGKGVRSLNMDASEYDTETRVLTIWFRNGTVKRFENVGRAQALCMTGTSADEDFAKNIESHPNVKVSTM